MTELTLDGVTTPEWVLMEGVDIKLTITIHGGIARYCGINLSHKIHGVFDIPIIYAWSKFAQIFLKGIFDRIIRGSSFRMGSFSTE